MWKLLVVTSDPESLQLVLTSDPESQHSLVLV